jgi:hypothetical protein
MGQEYCPSQNGLWNNENVKDDKIKQAAIQILLYLQKHPEAKDTAEGIAQWWIREDVKIVEKALQLLAEEGVIEKKASTYRLNQNQ